MNMPNLSWRNHAIRSSVDVVGAGVWLEITVLKRKAAKNERKRTMHTLSEVG